MKRKAVTLQLEGEIPQSQSAYDLAVEEGYEGTEEQYGKSLATIPPTQEQFDAIPGRLSKLTTTTEKSDFHHITDSAASKVVDFGMEGKTEQESTEGRNWISEKFSDYESGAYSATDGTKTDNVKAVRVKELIPASDSYVYAYVESPVEGVKIIARGYGENQEFLYNLGELVSGSTKYIQADTKYIGITLLNDDTTMALSDWQSAFESGLKLYISSSTKTTYEPFTNGPSPNPDYPQEIVNAGVYNEETGRYEIGCRVGNKNLFDWDKVFAGNLMSSGQFSPGGQSRSLFVHLQPNTTYTFSQNTSNVSLGIFGIGLVNDEVNSKESFVVDKMITYSGGVSTGRTFTTEADTKMGVITFSRYLDDMPTNMQLEVDKSATDYVEPKPQNITLTSPVPLTKWDKLVKRDGVYGRSVWSKEQRVTANDLMSGNANSYVGSSTAMRVINADCVIDTNVYKQYTYCNMLSFVGNIHNITDGTIGMCCYYQSIYMRIPNTLLGVSDDVTQSEKETAYRAYVQKQYDNGEPIIIQYPTAEEVAFIPLPDEEQELLRNLETYYGVTNVYNEQGCPMWLTYVQDTKIAVDNKFNNIRQAILSLGGNV